MPALWTRDSTPDGFSWIDANDSSGNVLSFLRHGVDADGRPTVMACVANFSGSPKPDYRVGLPFAGRWREVLNTDAVSYGGSGWGNMGGVDAEQFVWHGRPASAVLQLPPAGVLWLAPEETDGPVRRRAAAEPGPAPAPEFAPSAASAAPVSTPPAPAESSGAEFAPAGAREAPAPATDADTGPLETVAVAETVGAAETVTASEAPPVEPDAAQAAAEPIGTPAASADVAEVETTDGAGTELISDTTVEAPESTVETGSSAAVDVPAEPGSADLDDATTRFSGLPADETTVRIPATMPAEEPTTRFEPPTSVDPTDDAPTPPRGIALDDQVLGEEAGVTADQPAGAATDSAGSSADPDEGPAATAHRSSTAQ